MARRLQPPPKPPEWHFRSFPVAYAFFGGAYAATFVILLTGGFIIYPLFLVTMFGTSFGTAHVIGHWFKRRTLDKERTRTEEDERERRALAAREARQAITQEGEPPPTPRRRRTRRR